MIDIHCHILPDYDDGADDLNEALEMARLAVHSGVTDIIATPHFSGEPEELEQLPIIDQRLTMLRTALDDAGIPLTLQKTEIFLLWRIRIMY